MAWLHMAHTRPLPPIWDLLDLQPNSETLHLLMDARRILSCGTPS
jgi:hypothetical protein